MTAGKKRAFLLEPSLEAIVERPISRPVLAYVLGLKQSHLNEMVKRWIRAGYVVDVDGLLTRGPKRLQRLTPAEYTRRMRDKRREAGQCVACKEPSPDHDRCFACRRVECARAQRRYDKRVAETPRRPKGCTARCAPVAAYLLEHGPMTFDDIATRFRSAVASPPRKRRNLNRWVKGGWLVRQSRDVFAAGPKAQPGAWVARALATRLRSPVDETSEEGSDQWLALAQLEHGPLSTDELAGDVLDCTTARAAGVMSDLERLGYAVERCWRWELVRRQEAAE